MKIRCQGRQRNWFRYSFARVTTFFPGGYLLSESYRGYEETLAGYREAFGGNDARAVDGSRFYNNVFLNMMLATVK